MSDERAPGEDGHREAIAEAVTELNLEAKRLYDAGQYAEALRVATVARAEAEPLGPHPATAGVWNNLAATYQKLARYDDADRCYDQLEALLQDAGVDDAGMTGMIAHGRGLMYHAQGRLAEAREKLQRAAELFEAAGDDGREHLAAALNVYGDTLRRLALFRDADSALQRSRELREAMARRDHPEHARTLWNLALLRKDEGRFVEADTLYRDALAIFQRAFPDGHPDIGETRAGLAGLRLAEGRYAEALEEAEHARDALQPHLPATRARIAGILNTMAAAHELMGRLSLAEPLYQQALTTWEQAFGPSSNQVAIALVNLAHVRHETGDLASARLQLERACRIFVDANHTTHPDYARALSGLVATERAAGNLEEARSNARTVLRTLRRALGEAHPDVITATASLAVLEEDCGDWAAAQDLLAAAAAWMADSKGEPDPRRALILDNLGMLAMAKGNTAEAETLLRSAVLECERVLEPSHPALAVPLDNLALCFAATGRWNEAVALKARAFALRSRAIGEVFAIGSERQRLAHVYQLQGDLHGLVALVMRSPSRSPETVRICADAVLRRKAIVVEALAAERNATLGARHPEFGPIMADLKDRRARLAAHMRQGPGFDAMASYKKGLDALLEECEALERTLVSLVPEAALDKRLRDVDCKAVAAALPAGSIVIELLVYRDLELRLPFPARAPWAAPRYLAILIPSARDHGEVELVDLGDATSVELLVENLGVARRHGVRDLSRPGLNELGSEASGSWNAAAEKLYDLLFAPIAHKLQGCARILVSPDGALARVPFAALPAGNATHMIDHHELVNLGAGRDVLRFGASRITTATPPLVIGDPDFDAWKAPSSRAGLRPFNRLLETLEEAVSVGRSLGVTPLIGKRAVERAIRRQPAPRVLHLATHGFFEPKAAVRPAPAGPEAAPGASPVNDGSAPRALVRGDIENPLLRSGVALAGANTWLAGGELPEEAEDGLLYADDVTGLDLSGTLVVLSACETGLGEVDPGEGVFGLQRAFAIAGARSMVMTLWKVRDPETKELMICFYEGLAKGLGCATALRRAQLAVRKNYNDVHIWGAFICQGDPGPIELTVASAGARASAIDVIATGSSPTEM